MAKKYLRLAGILKRLLFDKNMKAADLAREVNIPAPTIHRLVTGKSTRPYRSSLKPIADYFSINIEQLIGNESLEHNELQSKEQKNTVTSTIKYLSLLPWKSLSSNIPALDKSLYEQIPFIGKISNNSFATIIQDFSMEPVFARGSLLIFDSERTAKDRSYVLVELHDKMLFVFRQLLIDGDHKYLKPLNPDLNVFKMRLLTQDDKIVSTLIEARHIYKE